MINCFQKTFHLLASKSKKSFNAYRFCRLQMNVGLNFIPFTHFCSQNKKNMANQNNFGFKELNEDLSQHPEVQQLQQDIVQSIQNFRMKNVQEQVFIVSKIVKFVQMNMLLEIENPRKSFQIDNRIFDLVENEFGNINPFPQKNIAWDFFLSNFQIQTKFLKSFNSMELDEKHQLYMKYQIAHQSHLEHLHARIGPDIQMEKIQTCFFAQTLFTYLAKYWVEKSKEVFCEKQIDLLTYAFDSLLFILDEINTPEVDDQTKKQNVLNVLGRIQLIYKNINLFKFHQSKNFLISSLKETNEVIKSFENIIPFQDYVIQKIQFSFNFIKLAQWTDALDLLQDLYNLKDKKELKQQDNLIIHMLLYYCLTKIAKGQSQTKLINFIEQTSKISQEGFDSYEQTLYNLLAIVQNLHVSIISQKFQNIKPMFDKFEQIFNTMQDKVVKLIIVPILCNIVEYSPDMPTRLESASLLLNCIESLDYTDDSYYQQFQANFYKTQLSIIVSAEKKDFRSLNYSSEIIQLFKIAENEEVIQREIVAGVFR